MVWVRVKVWVRVNPYPTPNPYHNQPEESHSNQSEARIADLSYEKEYRHPASTEGQLGAGEGAAVVKEVEAR